MMTEKQEKRARSIQKAFIAALIVDLFLCLLYVWAGTVAMTAAELEQWRNFYQQLFGWLLMGNLFKAVLVAAIYNMEF